MRKELIEENQRTRHQRFRSIIESQGHSSMFLDENLDDDVIKMDTERILEQRIQKIDELVN